FQPRQVKGQSNADRPRQHFVVVDVDGESKWVNRLDYACINKDSANDEGDDAPKDTARGQVHFLQEERTPMVQRPTPNAQSQNQIAAFGVGCWALNVGRFLHLLFFSHSSHPPRRTKTSFKPDSSRKRRATSRLALQL